MAFGIDFGTTKRRLGALENRMADIEKETMAAINNTQEIALTGQINILKECINKLSEIVNRIYKIDKYKKENIGTENGRKNTLINNYEFSDKIDSEKHHLKLDTGKLEEQAQKISEIETILADQDKYLAELKNEILLKDEKIASMEAQHSQEKENTRSRIDGLVANERNIFLEKIGSKLKAEYANSQRLAEDDPARVILDNIFQELKNIGVKF